MFFTFPDDARWNVERQAVEFGVEIGEYRGAVRVPRRVFLGLLSERPTPERCVECDGEKFHFAQGFPRAEAPRFSVSNDTWLDCYRRAFGDKALALQATA